MSSRSLVKVKPAARPAAREVNVTPISVVEGDRLVAWHLLHPPQKPGTRMAATFKEHAALVSKRSCLYQRRDPASGLLDPSSLCGNWVEKDTPQGWVCPIHDREARGVVKVPQIRPAPRVEG